MRDFVRQFLLYSRSERRAVVALVCLIIIVILIPKAYKFYAVAPVITVDSSCRMAAAKPQVSDNDAIEDSESDRGTNEGRLFEFDPNTIGVKDWMALGLSEKQATTIEKYKAKGAIFYKPEDIRKIYVLSDTMKDKLIPYIRIASVDNRSLPDYSSKGNNKLVHTIEINAADSAAFESLYGIGPVLSARIIKFRNLLGGFYDVSQVGETYGISDSVFRQIKPHLSVSCILVKKININTAEYDTLRKHPYIHAKIAKAIINYRNANRKFENLEELRTIKSISDKDYTKILPYVKLEE